MTPPFYGCNNITGKPPYGFPLWGKLSPQVTDEGATAGHFPLIRRVPRHLLPKGEGFLLWLPPLGEAFLRKMHKSFHHILFDSTKMFFMGLQPLLLYSSRCIMES